MPRVEPDRYAKIRVSSQSDRVTLYHSPFSLGSRLLRLSQLSQWGRT